MTYSFIILTIAARASKSLILVLCSGIFYGAANGQDLEPRALTNLPTGMNFVILGYGYAHGNVLFDPALPLEDTKANLHTFMGAYLRSINLFGHSGKIDVVAPYGIGDWTGIYTGIDTATSRSGFGDIRFRLSFNFFGAPALKSNEFKDYRPESISGMSIQIIAPTGQYFSDRLINLGSNRWVFHPQWGFSKNYQKWIVETYIGGWFYTVNKNFWGGSEISQKPIFTVKFHGIRKFNNSSWLALDGGYGIGGRVKINGELRDNRISTIRLGATYAFPIGLHHTFRINGITAIRLEKGADFDALTVSYQYRWIKNRIQ